MKPDRETEQWVALSLVPGLGDETTRRLLAAFGGPGEILAASQPALREVIKPSVAQAIIQGPDRARLGGVLRWLEDPLNSIITLADPDYPRTLLQIPDPPPLLYLKGRRDMLNGPALAIVGSRNATARGIANTEAFAEALSNAGLCVVSGLALGIDAAAHRGGLRGAARSIAVVGTGLDIVYPAKNRELAHELAREGALISELPLGTPAVGSNFPRRNRIISGLARGCLVVEAAMRSGSLITAHQALEQGREVFAVPGSIHSPLSKGCHALIKQGAKLVENAQDVLEDLGWGATHSTLPASIQEPPGPDDGLLTHLGFDPTDVDTLCVRSGLTPDQVTASLLRLELDGRVESLPGGMYQRVR